MAGRRRYLMMAAALGASLAASACTAPPPPPLCPAPQAGEALVYVRSHGWHVDVGLAAETVDGKLRTFLDVFPGARGLMFGYGKKTFVTAPPDSASEYLLGPVPGPAVIQVTGLGSPPADAYPSGEVLVFRLPPGGARALSDFIWRDIARDHAGEPRLVGPGPFTGSLFYAAVTGYSLAHTCNTWVANALAAAGIPLDPDGVMFSNQVVDRAITAGACTARLPAG